MSNKSKIGAWRRSFEYLLTRPQRKGGKKQGRGRRHKSWDLSSSDYERPQREKKLKLGFQKKSNQDIMLDERQCQR